MVTEKLLSKHQLNGVKLLKKRLDDARAIYIECLECYLRVFNNPTYDDNHTFDVWRHRLTLACNDMLQAFDRYNKAFNSYTCYYSVCLGR